MSVPYEGGGSKIDLEETIDHPILGQTENVCEEQENGKTIKDRNLLSMRPRAYRDHLLKARLPLLGGFESTINP